MSDHTLGDGPIEAKHIEEMRLLAGFLDEQFNHGVRGEQREVGFVLLVFAFGERDGRCNYISNGADRRDIVKLFREQIKRFEQIERGEGLQE